MTVTYWAAVAAGVTVVVVVAVAVQVVVVATVGVLVVEALRTLDGLPLVGAAWRVDDCKERGTGLTTVVDNSSQDIVVQQRTLLVGRLIGQKLEREVWTVVIGRLVLEAEARSSN